MNGRILPLRIKMVDILHSIEQVYTSGKLDYAVTSVSKKTVRVSALKDKKAKAFSGCSKLKRVTIKSKVLKTVGKNAFQKIQKKAVIKVPKGKAAKYRKAMKKAGLAKTVKLK